MEQYGYRYKDEYQQLQGNIAIYPSTIFCTDLYTYSKETHAIHWYSASWVSGEKNFKRRLIEEFPLFPPFSYKYKEQVNEIFLNDKS